MAKIDLIARPELIVGQHEETGDDIAHQHLRTETNCTADDRGDRHEGSDIDTELADDRDDRDRPDDAH